MLLGAAVLTASRPAAGYHDDASKPQSTDRSAYTVPQGMHKIGLFSIEYGLADGLELITWPVWWQLLSPNAGLEWRFVNTGKFAMSAALSGQYLSTRPWTAFFPDWQPADIGIIPLELLGSWRFHPSWTWSFGGLLTAVTLSGSFEEEAFQGAAAVTNLQAHTTFEWRLGRVVALQLHGRYLVFQTTKASAQLDLHPDEYTTIRAAAGGKTNVLDFPKAFQLVPGAHFSWETFNLRLGLGFGNYVVPAINFVLPNRSLVPELDLYWRF